MKTIIYINCKYSVIIIYFVISALHLHANDEISTKKKTLIGQVHSINRNIVEAKKNENYNVDSAIYYFKKSLSSLCEIQKQQNDKRFNLPIVKGYYLLINTYITSGDINSAKTNFSLIVPYLKLIENNEKYKLMGDYYKYCAYITINKGNLKNTLEFIQNAELIFENTKNNNGLAYCSLLTGIVNLEKKSSKRSIEYFYKAINIFKGENNLKGIIYGYNYLSSAYRYQNDFDSAYYYYDKSLLICENNKFYVDLITCYNQSIYFSTIDQKNNKTLECLNKALYLSEKTDNINGEILTLCNLSLFYGNTLVDKSISYCKRALLIAKQNENNFYLQNIYFNLFNANYYKHDYKEALNYLLRYNIYYKYANNESNNRIISELEIKYETVKKDNEIKMQKLSIENKNNQIINILVGLFMFILATISILYLYFIKQRAYKSLVLQNYQIVQQNYILQSPENKKYTSIGLSSEEKEDLIFNINELIINDEIYKDVGITIDLLAKKLNTNRTYLSQIINEHFNLTFNNFINKYRIEEARRILSDINSNKPIKVLYSELGFNSLDAFYKSFKKFTGITPSYYRKTVKIIQK